MLIICEKVKSVSVFDVTCEMDKSDHTRLENLCLYKI